jgi:uncharacterized membrane protein
MAVTLDANGRAKVHLSIDLSKNEGSTWAKLWGSLLSATIFIPITSAMVSAVDSLALSCGGPARAPLILANGPYPDPLWWRQSLQLSEDFIRDVSGAMVPGGSAIFMLLRHGRIPTTLRQLRDYGDTLIHTSLGPEQEQKVSAMLAGH